MVLIPAVRRVKPNLASREATCGDATQHWRGRAAARATGARKNFEAPGRPGARTQEKAQAALEARISRAMRRLSPKREHAEHSPRQASGDMACSSFGRICCDTSIYSRAARYKPVDSLEAAQAA